MTPDHGRTSRPIQVVVFGTPVYALPLIKQLAQDDTFDLLAVVTQPDRPAGRGHGLSASPVKQAALDLQLPLLQLATMRDTAIKERLRAFEADLFVVAAFGLIFGQSILEIPHHGCVNLHASILPSYRGAAPVTAAILSGDLETGITLMKMERGLDTGAMISVARTPVLATDTTDVLTSRLAELGADLAVRDLPRYVSGDVVPDAQRGQPSLVRRLLKEDGQVDWSKSAAEIERHVRAMWPWPRAWTSVGGQILQIHAARLEKIGKAKPGEIVRSESGLAIGTGDGLLVVEKGQLPGGKPLNGSELARNPGLLPGQLCKPPQPPDVPLIQKLESI
jgi:methionyl-tRNA formyltransferase